MTHPAAPGATTHVVTSKAGMPCTAPSADGDDVVLLDESGNPIGAADRRTIHTDQTPLHLAFSTYLFDADDRLLLTQRAHDKVTWPSVWTNSCCGHPRPGEDPTSAASRRIREELGLVVKSSELRCVAPDFRYRAIDAQGVVENEMCPVYVAEVDSAAHDARQADPEEIADSRWVPWREVIDRAANDPASLSPWAVLQIPLVAAARPPRSVLEGGGDSGPEGSA
jgi:isopentenyl-diphosphate delta-isomerase type 1